MRAVLCGVVGALSLVAALHFRRFGKKSGDAFFNLFALAFVLLAANSLALGVNDAQSESVALYALRLAAFLVILLAIWQKNRR